MTNRLVVRGGRVIDGSGLPGFTGDVEIVDGVITSVGRVDALGAEVIEADGLVVAPGFIDLHTHYDAQLHYEPTASPSSWHGVTTVITGNCGFTLAPAKPADVPWLLKMLSRVEGMSEQALAAGVTFGGGTMGDFLSGLEGKVGVNVAGYVGHAAIRRQIMGQAASEREATADEIGQMRQLVHDAMVDGAVGFSTSQLELHRDHEGNPVPCNLASSEEIVSLAGALASFDHGSVSFFPRTFGTAGGFDDHDKDLLLRVAVASGKPIQGNVVTFFRGSPDGWRHNMAFTEKLSTLGHRFYPMLVLNPKGVFFALDSTFLFDEYPIWRDCLVQSLPERVRRLNDPAMRRRLADELANPGDRAFRFGWDEVLIVTTRDDSNRPLENRSIEAVAAETGRDPLDVMLDLAAAEDLETLFSVRRKTVEPEMNVIRELVDHPMVMMGSSDGGAHLLTFCGADYTTRLLSELVPSQLSMEKAVSKLTFVPATAVGLWDRGLLRPGMAGDIVVFDPEALGVGPVRMVRDLPTAAARLVFPAEGYHSLVVNGELLLDKGEATGALPGQVLRGGRG